MVHGEVGGARFGTNLIGFDYVLLHLKDHTLWAPIFMLI